VRIINRRLVCNGRYYNSIFHRMRHYYMIENLQTIDNLIAKKKKKQIKKLFHAICGLDDRCRMDSPMIDVPNEGVSISLYVVSGNYYPPFSPTSQSIIPVVLRTEDVGKQAYSSMVKAGRLVPVPPGAEGVAESLELLFIIESSTSSLLFPVLFNICDRNNESYDPKNAYDLCLLFLVKDFVGDQTFGTPASRMQFKADAAAHIKECKEGGVFPFAEMTSRILNWCNTHYESYEDDSGSDFTD
jgi:hypothetical protein